MRALVVCVGVFSIFAGKESRQEVLSLLFDILARQNVAHVIGIQVRLPCFHQLDFGSNAQPIDGASVGHVRVFEKLVFDDETKLG